MVNVLHVVLVTAGATIIPVALGYWLWVKTRPRKLSWTAFVYQSSEAKFKLGKDNKAELSKLVPYARDTLIREENKKGVVIFKLVTLNKAVPEPTPDVVELLPNLGKVVRVLYKDDVCTLIKTGYDSARGGDIWNPLPYDKYTSLKNDMALQLERVQEKKDLLAQLLPYVAIIIAFMAIIGLGFIMGSSNVKVAKENRIASEIQAEAHLSPRFH